MFKVEEIQKKACPLLCRAGLFPLKYCIFLMQVGFEKLCDFGKRDFF